MTLAFSRFKVANGLEEAVRDAFFHRPHLVDTVSGFLGLEAFTETDDSAVFYLLTRWTDIESFRKWHSGPLHTLGHRHIPKGLKLDASFTTLRTLERIAASEQDEDSARDSASLIAKFVSGSTSVHWIRSSPDGQIESLNAAVERTLNRSRDELEGTPIWDILTEPDAATLRRLAGQSGRAPGEHYLFNVAGQDGSPVTLQCHLDVQPDGFLLIGEPVLEHDAALQEQLLGLNNQLSVLLRENERKAKALRKANEELEKALQNLEQAHWHLRKIQETLPICMTCGKVKTGESRWDTVVDYLRNNSLFLSHGFCPACFEEQLRLFEAPRDVRDGTNQPTAQDGSCGGDSLVAPADRRRSGRRLFDPSPDWVSRYGERARQFGIEDAGFHQDFLAAAVDSGKTESFAEYSR